MMEFFQEVVNFIYSVLNIIATTADNIDTIKFESTVFADWMGYARYAMGDPLYILFTTTILISIGVTLWTYLIKGIGYLRGMLPW